MKLTRFSLIAMRFLEVLKFRNKSLSKVCSEWKYKRLFFFGGGGGVRLEVVPEGEGGADLVGGGGDGSL